MQVNNDIRNLLGSLEWGVDRVDIPSKTPLYAELKKLFPDLGLRWDRKLRTHLLVKDDARDIIESVIETGQITVAKDFGYFPTPDAIVDLMIERGHLEPGMRVLEPSAGQGAIARRLAALGCIVDCVEILPENVRALRAGGFASAVYAGDFLDFIPDPSYDRVLMNPPFVQRPTDRLRGIPQADLRHVRHAADFLQPNGLLVAVMSRGVQFRMNEATRSFREVFGSNMEMEPLPDGSFLVSGTGVNTVMVRASKTDAMRELRVSLESPTKTFLMSDLESAATPEDQELDLVQVAEGATFEEQLPEQYGRDGRRYKLIRDPFNAYRFQTRIWSSVNRVWGDCGDAMDTLEEGLAKFKAFVAAAPDPLGTYTRQELDRMPSLAHGTAHDLKAVAGPYQLWVSHMLDGEEYDNEVALEYSSEGHWVTVNTWNALDVPDEGLPPLRSTAAIAQSVQGSVPQTLTTRRPARLAAIRTLTIPSVPAHFAMFLNGDFDTSEVLVSPNDSLLVDTFTFKSGTGRKFGVLELHEGAVPVEPIDDSYAVQSEVVLDVRSPSRLRLETTIEPAARMLLRGIADVNLDVEYGANLSMLGKIDGSIRVRGGDGSTVATYDGPFVDFAVAADGGKLRISGQCADAQVGKGKIALVDHTGLSVDAEVVARYQQPAVEITKKTVDIANDLGTLF